MGNLDKTDGPRSARADERKACIALADRVFRLDLQMPASMGREFPTLFAEDNVDKLYVLGVDGQLVSLAGVYEQRLLIRGVEIPVACVGAVCTHADYQGRGYAGRLMDLAMGRAREAGNRIMLISGSYSLYLKRGASRVRSVVCASLPADRAVAAPLHGVRDYTPDDLPAVMRLHKDRTPRFQWDSDSTAALMDAHMNLGCGAWVYAPGRSVEGFLLIRHRQPLFWGVPGHGDVIECFGDAEAATAMASVACRELEINVLDFPIVHGETARRDVIGQLDVTWTAEASRWTVKVLDLAGLLADWTDNRSAVRLSGEGEALVMTTADGTLTLNKPDDVHAALFNESEHWPDAVRSLPRRDRAALSDVLPIPLCSYGINYI